MARDVASITSVFYIHCHTEQKYVTTLLVQCGHTSYIFYVFISNLQQTPNEINHQLPADISKTATIQSHRSVTNFVLLLCKIQFRRKEEL